jgi:ABC-type multidrug transport system ATPase subunit
MEQVLEIRHLFKNYGKFKAVVDLNLSIAPGSVFGLLGPNGSGKTTTLGVVLGVLKKTNGSFSWFGKNPSAAIRKKIGAILEAPSFYPYLTAEENLKIIAQIKNIPYSQIDIVLEKVSLLARKNDKFQAYSLGMKQRLAIASALLSDPYVLVLDEPTNGLDPQGIADVRELIIKISGEGKTILLASHLLDEVQKVCTHYAVLNKGKVIYTGEVAETLSKNEAIELAAPDIEQLIQMIKTYPFCSEITQNHLKVSVRLSEGKTSFDLNQYLVNKGIVVSHLATEHGSLEQQFLEILSQSNDQAISN